MKVKAARDLAVAGVPDPMCKTGIVSIADGAAQVCCAGYCDECTDYPTCASVRGQNSTFACCKTEVYKRRCGSAPANVCLKSCKDSVPPCIMETGKVFTTPDPSARTAGSDCGDAVSDWNKKAAASMKSK